LAEAFFSVEGAEPGLSKILSLMAALGNEAKPLDKAKKTLYHCAAVLVSNFSVALAFAGAELLAACDLGEAQGALFRLMLNNARSIGQYGPVAALTGPVERGDAGTVAEHLAALGGEDRELYRLLTKKLLKVASLKRPGQDRSELARLLDSGDFSRGNG
jgi:predicted short-subunit dehydrogenase-like oxidoreductase (DUF2520 family)